MISIEKVMLLLLVAVELRLKELVQGYTDTIPICAAKQ